MYYKIRRFIVLLNENVKDWPLNLEINHIELKTEF